MRMRVAVVVLGLILAVSCGREINPVGPSVVTAHITSIEPGQITPSASPIPVIVHGTSFLATAQLVIAKSDGSSQLFAGSDIQNRSTTSFEVRATFSTPGVYTFMITNSPNDVVDPFVITVSGGQNEGSPTLTNVSPVTAVRSANPQVLLFSGTNFQGNMSIVVVDPLGFPTTYGVPQVVVLSDTQVQFSLVLDKLGNYVFRAVLTDGRISNQLTVLVN